MAMPRARDERAALLGEVAWGHTHAVLWDKRVTRQRRGYPTAVED